MPLNAHHFSIHKLSCFTLLLLAGFTHAQEPARAPSAAIEGIKGVKQEAVESIKKVEPPTANPVPPPTVSGVKTTAPPAPPSPPPANPVAPNAVQGVKDPAPTAAPPPPPPPPNAVAPNTVNGVKAPAPNAVQPVPPPPVGNAVSTIRAVKGVEGIAVPKQRNLEAALQIKAGGRPDPKGNAAAAALFGKNGKAPAPAQDGDGRAALQEFEKQTAPGS